MPASNIFSMGRFINIFSGPDGLAMHMTGAPFIQACDECTVFFLLLDGELEVNGGNLSSGQLAYCGTEPDIRYIPDRNSRGIVMSVPRKYIRGADDRIGIHEESLIRTVGENDRTMLEHYFEILMDERQGSSLDGSTVSLVNALLVRLAGILE